MVTRDEILNMKAGPEMNALVAEVVMGWKHVNVPLPGINTSPPFFSTDIDAAWVLLEQFTDFDIEKAGGNYRVTINVFAQADAQRVPLAICRAALLARGNGTRLTRSARKDSRDEKRQSVP